MRLETNDLVRLQQWWPRAFSHTLCVLPYRLLTHACCRVPLLLAHARGPACDMSCVRYKLPVADAHHTVQRQQPALTPALVRALLWALPGLCRGVCTDAAPLPLRATHRGG